MPTVPRYERQYQDNRLERVVSMPKPDASVFGGSAQGLANLGSGLAGAGQQVAGQAMKERADKLITDIDADMQNEQVEFNRFQEDLRSNTPDRYAKEVIPAKTAEFLKSRRAGLEDKYKHSPLGLTYLNRKFGGFATSAGTNAYSYASDRDRAFTKQTYENEETLAIKGAGELSTPWEAAQAGLQDVIAKRRALFGPDEAHEAGILEKGRAARQESVVQRDTATTQGDPAFAESLPRELKDAPEEYKELFTPVEYDAHRARLVKNARDYFSAQGMNAKNLLGNYQSYKEHAIETGDFGPMQQTAAALAAAGPDYVDKLAAVERDIETYSAVRPMTTLNTSRPLVEQEREGLDYLHGRKNPENTAYMNDVMHDVARGYDAQRKAIKADPAAFVEKDMAGFEGLSGEDRAAISLERQADLYAGTDIVPQVLTRERRDYIQQQWSSDSYQDKMNLVAEVQREYGAFAAQALDEAKIPDAVVTTAPIFSALDQGVQARWMAAASTKQGDIPADSETRKVVKEEVGNSAMMQALRSAWKATHNSEAQFELMNGVQNTLENYVLLGGKLGDIEKSFAIINDSGSALVMPASEYTRDFEVLLDAARDEWRGTVPDYIDKLKEPARSQELSLWRSQIANGNFVYSLADRGAVLCDEATGKIIYGTKPVQPREVTYEERMKRGLANSGKALMGWGSI